MPISFCSATSRCSFPRYITARCRRRQRTGSHRFQAVFSLVGAILFPIGIACVRLGDRHRFMPVLVGGWLTVLTGMLLFVMIVYRSSGRAVAQATLNTPQPTYLT